MFICSVYKFRKLKGREMFTTFTIFTVEGLRTIVV